MLSTPEEEEEDSRRVIGRPSTQLRRLGEGLRHRFHPESRSDIHPGLLIDHVERPPLPQADPVRVHAAASKVLSIPTAVFPTEKMTAFEFHGYKVRDDDMKPPLQLGLSLPRRRYETNLGRLDIPTLDQCYISVAARILQSFRQRTPISPFHEFQELVQDREDETVIAEVWNALMAMTSISTGHPTSSLMVGARSLFEKRYHRLIEDVVKYGAQAIDAGLEMDASHLFMTFARCRRAHEVSHDQFHAVHEILPWRTLYDALRAGDYGAVSILAEKVHFPLGFMDASPSEYFETWMNSDGGLPLALVEASSALLSSVLDGMQKTSLTIDERYMIMVLSFLSGQIHFVDALMCRSSHVWDSFDEYLWFTLGCVRCDLDCTRPRGMLDLAGLHERVNSYGEDYYKQGRKESLYLTMLFCTLQFKKALIFLLKMSNPQDWIVHVVHLAIALDATEILDKGGAEDELTFPRTEISRVIEKYATTFVDADIQAHWQYYFFALKIKAAPNQQQNELLLESIMEVLVQNNSREMELTRSAKAAMDMFEPDPAQRNTLYKKLGKQLETKGELDLSFKCHLAGGQVPHALKNINKLIASKIADLPCEPLLGYGSHYQADVKYIAVLLTKFRSVKGKLHGVDLMNVEITQASAEAEELRDIFFMMSELWKGAYHKAMEKFQKLTFIPKHVDDIPRYIHRLRLNLRLIYSILHKILGVFCICCKHVEKSDNDWRAHLEMQTGLFQRFVQATGQDYIFANQLSQDLAHALTD